MITRTKLRHFCCAADSLGGCIPKGTARVSLSPGPILLSVQSHRLKSKHSSGRALPAQLSQQAAPHIPPWAQVWGHLTLYTLSGSSSPRPAEFLSPSHTPARQTQTLSLDFPWLPRGKGRGYKTGWRGEAGAAQVQLCCPH